MTDKKFKELLQIKGHQWVMCHMWVGSWNRKKTFAIVAIFIMEISGIIDTT